MIIIADIVVFLSIFMGLACIVGTYRGIKSYKQIMNDPKTIWLYNIIDRELLSFHNTLMDSIQNVIERIKDSNAKVIEIKGTDQDETFDISNYNFYSGSIMIHKSFYLFMVMIFQEEYIDYLIIDPKSNSVFQISTQTLSEISDIINSSKDSKNAVKDIYKYLDDNDCVVGDVQLLKKFTKQLNKYKNKYIIDNIIATNQNITEVDMFNKSYLEYAKNKEKSIEEKPTE
jgi:hypothetical protein